MASVPSPSTGAGASASASASASPATSILGMLDVILNADISLEAFDASARSLLSTAVSTWTNDASLRDLFHTYKANVTGSTVTPAHRTAFLTHARVAVAELVAPRLQRIQSGDVTAVRGVPEFDALGIADKLELLHEDDFPEMWMSLSTFATQALLGTMAGSLTLIKNVPAVRAVINDLVTSMAPSAETGEAPNINVPSLMFALLPALMTLDTTDIEDYFTPENMNQLMRLMQLIMMGSAGGEGEEASHSLMQTLGSLMGDASELGGSVDDALAAEKLAAVEAEAALEAQAEVTDDELNAVMKRFGSASVSK